MKIEDIFLLNEEYLIVTPDFELPEKFESQSALFKVEQPNSTIQELEGELVSTHFRLTSGKSKYAVVLRFKGVSKEDLPIGSKLYSTSDLVKNLVLCA